MTTIDSSRGGYQSYAHPLLSWGSVAIGAVTAVALGVFFNLLGVVFDAVAVSNSIGSDHADAGLMALGAAVWAGLANIVALLIGGFVAARSANHPDHHDGVLHGFAVWAVAFVVAVALLGTGAHRALGPSLIDQGAVAQAEGGQQGAQAESDAPGPMTTAPASAAQTAAAQKEAQEIAKAGAQATAATAFFGFGVMLVGLVAALIGGILGARHPTHFAHRPRRTAHADATTRQIDVP